MRIFHFIPTFKIYVRNNIVNYKIILGDVKNNSHRFILKDVTVDAVVRTIVSRINSCLFDKGSQTLVNNSFILNRTKLFIELNQHFVKRQCLMHVRGFLIAYFQSNPVLFMSIVTLRSRVIRCLKKWSKN